MITHYKANAIGKNQKFVNETLEKKYKENMTLTEGLQLVAKCLNNNIDHPKKNSEIVVISKQDIKFLTEEELEKLYDSIDEE